MNAEQSSTIEGNSHRVGDGAVASPAGQAWRRLGLRLRSLTPSGLIRFLIVIGALTGLGWLIWQTQVALIPFIIGGVIAYILLPLVNWLDRFLPRIVAVLLALSLMLLGLILFLVLLVPIVAEQIYYVYLTLPGLDELRAYLDQARTYLATLPEPTQALINDAIAQADTKIRENLNLYLSGLLNLTITTVLGLVNTVAFVLGFVVVPAWLLTVLGDQPKAFPALNQMLPAWLRPDFWAVLRIFDRAFRTFIQGQMLLALVVALLVYVGLELLIRLLGLQGNVEIQLLLALIAGLTQLIPSIGPFLGVIPAILVGLSISWEATLLVIGLYILVQWLVNSLVASQVERRIVDVHPAILIIIIVALSEFGFWWILLAAPVTAIVRDLFRYAYGRFSDPPRPAGILPGEAVPLPTGARQQPTPPQRRAALAFRPPQKVGPTGQGENL